MKIPAIKKLCQQYSREQLAEAEEQILDGETLAIEIEGDDEGEQLTHVLAAQWVLLKMDAEGWDFRTAIREYTQKVRSSIN